VLVPELAGLRRLKVGPSDIQAIADTVRQLAATTEGGAGEDPALGLVAFSYAAGPALLAALEPDVGEALGFLLLVGGYHSVEALATFVTTGNYRASPSDAWERRAPNPRGKWVFLLSNVDRVENPGDRALLRAIGEKKFDDPEADVTALSARLGEEGRAIEAYLNNADPARVPALIDALPAGIRADMVALDPSKRDLAALRPRLYLVHGKDDAVIPYTESRALAAAAPDAVVFEIDRLGHVDLGPADWLDALTLWRAAYLLLGERGDETIEIRR